MAISNREQTSSKYSLQFLSSTLKNFLTIPVTSIASDIHLNQLTSTSTRSQFFSFKIIFSFQSHILKVLSRPIFIDKLYTRTQQPIFFITDVNRTCPTSDKFFTARQHFTVYTSNFYIHIRFDVSKELAPNFQYGTTSKTPRMGLSGGDIYCMNKTYSLSLKSMHCVKSVQIQSFFWSASSCIRREYRKNTDQKKLRILTLFTQ